MAESIEKIDVINDDGWDDLLAWLPECFEEKMRETGAFARSRKIKRPSDLLRIALAYPVLNKSLPDLSRWASEKNIADLSFISIWERMQTMVVFLRWLVGEMLTQLVLPVESNLILAPVDATTFSVPGSIGRDWIVHMMWVLGQPTKIRLSKLRGKNSGESFKYIDDVPKNAVMISDRAYGIPSGLNYAIENGMKFIVRYSWSLLPLYETEERETVINPEQKLANMKCGEILEFTAWVKDKKEIFPLRIVVVKKDKKSSEKALKKTLYESRKKGFVTKNITKFTSQFISLATNLNETEATKENIAEAYRWRWQIELEFKHFKSTTYIRKLVNQKDTTVEVYLLAAMVAWLISHKIAQQKSFFPWGYPLRKSC